LDNLPSAILWTWPYHVSWFCSISFIVGSSNSICCLIVTSLILPFLDILEECAYSLSKDTFSSALNSVFVSFSLWNVYSSGGSRELLKDPTSIPQRTAEGTKAPIMSTF
jgi:hypothetical protein